jgi:hypothetical protein
VCSWLLGLLFDSPVYILLVAHVASPLTLKIEAVPFSKTLVNSCCLAQGEKPDSYQVVLTGRDLGDQERTSAEISTHIQHRLFSKDLLLTALIVLQMHSSNQLKSVTWVRPCLLRHNSYNRSRKESKEVVGDTPNASAVSEMFSVPGSISEDRHLPWFIKILAKAIPLTILIG